MHQYRLYLDEHGVEKTSQLQNDMYRYLSLTGVVMTLDHARDVLQPELDRLRAEIFDQDPDQPICLHRSDIKARRGPFQCLNDPDKLNLFNTQLLLLMNSCEYVVITAFIDKLWMTQQLHWDNKHPYHYLMEIIVEKYAQFLKRKDATGDIMPEARGNQQDTALQSQFDRCRLRGTRYANARTINTYILFAKLKFRTKKDNCSGLQLCDMLAHPSHYVIRKRLNHNVNLQGFALFVERLLIEEKYDRSNNGQVNGYGIKHLP